MILLKAKIFLLVCIGLLRDKRLFWFQKRGFEYQDPMVWTKSLYYSQNLYYKQQSWRDCRMVSKPFSSSHCSHCPHPQDQWKISQVGGKKILGERQQDMSNRYEFLRKGPPYPAYPRIKSMVLESGPLRRIPGGFLGGPESTRSFCLTWQAIAQRHRADEGPWQDHKQLPIRTRPIELYLVDASRRQTKKTAIRKFTPFTRAGVKEKLSSPQHSELRLPAGELELAESGVLPQEGHGAQGLT